MNFKVDESSICEICQKSTRDLLKCNTCSLSVHSKCYGMHSYKQNWTCDRCKAFNRDQVPVSCKLCEGQIGALRYINNDWYHLVCLNWLPSIKYNNSSIVIANANTTKDCPRVCAYCKKSTEYYMYCVYPNCEKTFHPMCALMKGLFPKTELKFIISCEYHFLREGKYLDLSNLIRRIYSAVPEQDCLEYNYQEEGDSLVVNFIYKNSEVDLPLKRKTAQAIGPNLNINPKLSVCEIPIESKISDNSELLSNDDHLCMESDIESLEMSEASHGDIANEQSFVVNETVSLAQNIAPNSLAQNIAPLSLCQSNESLSSCQNHEPLSTCQNHETNKKIANGKLPVQKVSGKRGNILNANTKSKKDKIPPEKRQRKTKLKLFDRKMNNIVNGIPSKKGKYSGESNPDKEIIRKKQELSGLLFQTNKKAPTINFDEDLVIFYPIIERKAEVWKFSDKFSRLTQINIHGSLSSLEIAFKKFLRRKSTPDLNCYKLHDPQIIEFFNKDQIGYREIKKIVLTYSILIQ